MNENPEVTVRQDNTEEQPDRNNRVNINVKGIEKSIDYLVKTEGNNVRVPQDYDNKIKIPGVPKFVDVAVDNKPDAFEEAGRRKRPGNQMVMIRRY